MVGKLILVVGPSGSGKGTLIKHIRSRFPLLKQVVTCTTRAPRPHEQEGVDRFFLSQEQFDQRIQEGFFLEWAEYGGHRYGTPYTSVVPLISEGTFVIEELEVQGARQILERLPREDIITVFVDAGSWQEMEKRVRDRAPISDYELMKRRERYDDEMTFKSEADIVISNRNGELEEAKKHFETSLRSRLS